MTLKATLLTPGDENGYEALWEGVRNAVDSRRRLERCQRPVDSVLRGGDYFGIIALVIRLALASILDCRGHNRGSGALRAQQSSVDRPAHACRGTVTGHLGRHPGCGHVEIPGIRGRWTQLLAHCAQDSSDVTRTIAV